MRFLKKFAGLFAAALLLLPSLGQAYTVNGNLDVRGNIVGGSARAGANNLSLALSSGTLTIQCVGPTGTAATCSTSNPGWITLPSNTAGQVKTYKITSTITFDDDSAGDSDFQGTGTCSWGTSTAVAWGNTLPLLVGAFHDGTTLAIGIGRGPVLTTGASTNIGYKDVCPSSASQNNVIAFTASNITSTHANKAFFPIGAVRATKSSVDDWTFAALDDGDGIGIFYNFGIRDFDMPAGQMGTVSGRYFFVSGGTAPTYTALNLFKYRISPEGMLHVTIQFHNTAGGTAGAGTNPLAMGTPLAYAKYSSLGTGVTPMVGVGYLNNSGTHDTLTVIDLDPGSSGFVNFAYQAAVVTTSQAVNGVHQNNVARQLTGTYSYPAF